LAQVAENGAEVQEASGQVPAVLRLGREVDDQTLRKRDRLLLNVERLVVSVEAAEQDAQVAIATGEVLAVRPFGGVLRQ
jgi:hypothetical protein